MLALINLHIGCPTFWAPLQSRLHNIRNAKVVEQQWKRVWGEIKYWGTKLGGRWREEAHKLNASTILTYMNAPLMDSFAGTNETIV